MTRKIFLTCLIALSAITSWGQAFQFLPDKFVQRMNSTDIISNPAPSYNDALPFTTHDKWQDAVNNAGSQTTGFVFKSIQDYVRIGIRQDIAPVVGDYDYNVTVSVKCYNPVAGFALPGTPPAATFTTVIPVSWHPGAQAAYNDLSVYKFSGYQAIQVNITNITLQSNPSASVSRASLGANFYVESGVEVQRNDLAAITLNPAASISSGNIFIDWTQPSMSHGDQNPKPVQYDLEWLYTDDYTYDLPNGSGGTNFSGSSNVNYDFRKNSTRVRVSGTTYIIPLVYEHGAIIYRIRTVKPDMATGYKDLQFGNWTLPDYGTASLSNAAQGVFISNAHSHDSLNWQYTINFAEEGKYKHVINYFDGSLKDRQTQTKINTDNNYVVAVDKVYDYEGRPSIQTLPVPMLQQNLQYRPDVTINSATSKPYTAADFDKNCLEPVPSPIPALSSTAAAQVYYSPLNPDKTGMQQYVPDAQGYPFIQSIYSPDNTNKVLVQGGAGLDHQPSGGHGTKYEYVRANQAEIDRLLGTEAGKYDFYPKQVVTDPNGQSSFTVMNPAGKVVATGMAGTIDHTTMPISDLDNITSSTTICTDMLHNMTQQQSSDRLTAENSLFVDNDGSASSVKYSVAVAPFPTGCSNQYLRAMGTYTVRLTNECGLPFMNTAGHTTVDSGTVGANDVITSATVPNPVWQAGPQVNGVLNKAKYLVKKELSFSEYSIDSQVTGFIHRNQPACYNDSNYFIRKAVESAVFPCIDSGATNMCDLRRKEMIKDLWPGAKYGLYNQDSFGSFCSGTANSIFSNVLVATPSVDYCTFPDMSAWSFTQSPFYTSQNGYNTPRLYGTFQCSKNCEHAFIQNEDGTYYISPSEGYHHTVPAGNFHNCDATDYANNPSPYVNIPANIATELGNCLTGATGGGLQGINLTSGPPASLSNFDPPIPTANAPGLLHNGEFFTATCQNGCVHRGVYKVTGPNSSLVSVYGYFIDQSYLHRPSSNTNCSIYIPPMQCSCVVKPGIKACEISPSNPQPTTCDVTFLCNFNQYHTMTASIHEIGMTTPNNSSPSGVYCTAIHPGNDPAVGPHKLFYYLNPTSGASTGLDAADIVQHHPDYTCGNNTTILRYQSPCITLAQPITINGTQYTSLAGIDPQTLINNFSDKIAEALLPLHPEYCKLLACNDGPFEQQMENLNTWQQAQAANRFMLDDIINNDPMYTTSPSQPDMYVSLAYLRGDLNGEKIDSVALRMAYCNAGNNGELTACAKDLNMYGTQITNFQFATDDIKQKYFEILKQLYFGNREYLKQQNMDTTTGGGCGPCADKRMKLTGQPVFPVMFGAYNNVNTGATGMPQWMADLFNQATNGALSPTVPVQLTNNITAFNNDKTAAIVSGIIARLQNCTVTGGAANTTALNNLAADLTTFLQGGGTLTPAILKTKMQAAGLITDDLCHPFLTAYNAYDGTSSVPFSYACAPDALYADMAAFYGNSNVIAALTSATASGGNTITLSLSGLSGNSFAAKIQQYYSGITGITPSSVTLQAFTAHATNVLISAPGYPYIRMRVLPVGTSVAATDELYLYFKGRTEHDPSITTAHSLDLNIATSVNVTGVICLNNDNAATNSGAVAANSAVLTAMVNGSAVADSYYVWNNKIAIMQAVGEASLANAITCVEMKTAMDNFHADQSTYLYDEAANHPLYEQTLTNYLNYYFKKQYSFDDYYDLINGCAVTDKVTIPRHTATAHVHLFGSQPSAFNNAMAAYTSRELVAYTVGWPGGAGAGAYDLYLDLNIVPDDSIAWYKNKIAAAGLSAGGQVSFMENGSEMIFAKNDAANNTPSLTGSILSGSGYLSGIHSDNVTLDENGTPVNYTLYTCTLTGSNPYSYSQSLAGVKAMIQQYNAFAFYDRELQRSSDYNTQAKQDYLNYVYGLAGSSHDAIIAAIDPAVVKTTLATDFSGFNTLTYADPYCTGVKTDLYAYGPANTSYPGFTKLVSILSNIDPNQGLGTYNRLFPNVNFTYCWTGALQPGVPPPTTYSVARKANGTYWYRYFDANNRMYNIYITPPANTINLAGYRVANFNTDLTVTQGDDSSRTFSVNLTNGTYTITCRGYTDFTIGYCKKLQHVVLLKDYSKMVCFDSLDCERDHLITAVRSGQAAYLQYFDSVKDDMSHRMMAWLLNNSKDTLIVCTKEQKYQYTLYYYDRAGNLTRTVPPAGVQVLSGTTLASVDPNRNNTSPSVNGLSLTSHNKVSYYQYNSLNQLVYQKTPDGGITYFFYDAAGRLVFSQNSKQRPGGQYSYTLYDDQGRVTETGQAALGCTLPDNPNILFDNTPCSFPDPAGGTVTSVHPPYVANADKYLMSTLREYVRLQQRTDVVITVYDTTVTDLGAIAGEHLSTQENLRKRVSSILYYQSIGNTSSNVVGVQNWHNVSQTPDFGTYYSYDMLGNVKTVSYSYQRLNALKERYKRVDYDYDQLSGKVNMVSYNRNRPDQFYHQYEYDADNRITKVTTSNDGVIWNTDARYSYYKHGPLASVKIGDGMLQSLEYAYTIQGWLKAINGDVRNPQKEMGQNGLPGDITYARDAIAHALDYFQNDYKPIGGSTSPVINLPGLTAAQNLWNGNIARQTTSIATLGNMQRTYQYDQLQRLKLATNAAVDENALTVASPSNLYKSTYAYDPDGNIQYLQRWDGTSGTQVLIDNFAYHYTAGNTDNKLMSVSDAAAATGGTDLQPGQIAANYKYDKIGNLVKDDQGHIKIDWNLYGKVKTITDTTSPNKVLNFDYDGTGNRIFKEYVIKNSSTNEDHKGEYYVRDATGNILSVYKMHSIYSPLQITQSTNTGIKANLGLPVLSAFIRSNVAPMPGFSTNMQQQALTDMPSWVQDRIAEHPTSYYMTQDADVYNRMLSSGYDYIADMRTADLDNIAQGNPGIISHALASQTVYDDGLGEKVFTAALLEPSPAYFLLLDFDKNLDPAYSAAVWSNMGMAWDSTDHDKNAQSLSDLIQRDPVNTAVSVAHLMSDNIISAAADPTTTASVTAFANAMENDGKIFEDAHMNDPTISGFLPNLKDVLLHYADQNAVSSFFDNWSSSADWLAQSTTPAQLLNVIYNQDADALIDGFVNNAQDVTLATAIANIPSLTTGQYLSLVSAKVASPGAILSQLTPVKDSISLSEHHIYGSSRLGIQNYDAISLRNVYDANTSSNSVFPLSAPSIWYSYAYGDLVDKSYKEPWGNTDVTAWLTSRNLGKRYYELNDHLGNVLATILDRKTGHVNGSNYDYYNADVLSATDYYPFGMPMPGRYANGDKTPNGYNGQRRDDEVYGTGNLNTAMFWEYDARLGRRWNVDPVMKSYESSYSTFGNNPLLNVDVNGDDSTNSNKKTDQTDKKDEVKQPLKMPTLQDLQKAPPEHPDYVPPKKGARKVKNPNGQGSGWIDKSGDVWVPTDHKGTHAPHWDVQHPNGTHTNVYPKPKLITSEKIKQILQNFQHSIRQKYEPLKPYRGPTPILFRPTQTTTIPIIIPISAPEALPALIPLAF